MVMQSLVYPWISLLPAPPGAKAQESPPLEASHSAETPAPSPLDPLLNPDTIFTSTNSAETITPEEVPEEVPEATPSATPEATSSATATPSATPSTTYDLQPTTSPSPSTTTPSPSTTYDLQPTTYPSPFTTNDLQPTTLPIISPFSISLQHPFAGSYPTSYGFGQRSPNSYISLMQSLFGVDAHDGLDFAMPIGTEILSASAGTIISAGPGLYGTTIQIEHSWGVSYYGHLSDTSVQAGDKVKVGQIIGYSGNSGVTTGPHLHFGIRPVSPNLLNGYHGMIDPAPYLQGIILPKILGTKDGKAIQNRARVRQIKNKFALAQNSLKNDDTNIKVNFAKSESSDLNIVLKNPKGFEIDITDQTLGTLTGPLGPSLDVNLTEVVDLVPGLYQLTITDALGNYETQDFSWGVLAINTNKTIYLPSTPVDFSMAVLDNQGDMVCDAQVDLSITSPSGIVTKLSSTTGEVTVNLVTCLSKTYTLNPDYQATFHPTELGNYEVNMSTTTVDGTRSISSSFRVSSSVPFDVERVTITRIYPRLDYPVILRVHANEDFVGTVEDVIPANFELIKPTSDQNPEYTVSARGDTQVISWNVVWQKGGDYVLSYQFNPPDKSPDFYTFGPLKIGNRFSEIKKWQLAIDVTTTIILNYAHTILTSGTTWTVPADWTDGDNTIEVIGGGGAGRTDTTGIAGAGGGGGGAYAKSVNIDLTPGGTVDYQIGQGGIPTSVNGTDTFFNRTSGTAGTCADTTSACAKGGTGATSATGTAGGTAASSFATGTGNVKNNGGTGGTGNTTSDSGGGGGGAGGPNGAGGTGGAGDTDNATDGVGGGGGGNGGGAAGGSGITSDTIGAAGGNGNGGTGGGAGGTAADGANGTAGTGGGGGGGSDNKDGGHGANGSDLVAGVAVGSGGGGGGTGDTATTTGMGGNGGLYGAGGGGGRYGGFGAPGVIIITYNGNTPSRNTWVVPADWNSADNTVTVIGGGGAGVSSAAGAGAGGGGGGGYSKSTNLSLTVGANIDYQVGAGGRKTAVGAGAGTAGTASFFNRTAGTANTCADTVSVCANPGAAGSGTTGGAGGSTTGADGSTLLAGGAGGAGNSTGDTSGGGGGAGGTAVGQVGGAGNGTTSGGGGGGGGAGGTSSSVGQAGQTGTGGTGGNGPAGTGSGAAGNAGHGGAGTAATGGGGGGGDDVFGGGAGGSGSSTTYGGGGGGGAGDNNTAATSQAYGGHGGLHGGAGGGGLTNGFGAEGIIIITYTPSEITISGTANGNDGATVKWAKNGTVQASTATIGASAWTITAITPPPSSGDIITVWVDGVSDANETTAVTKFTSGNISGMVLNTNVATVGSNQDTSLSLTDLENYDCTQDEDIMYQATSSHLKVEGDACAGSTTNTYTSEKLEILSGDTMTVATSETVTTYDLTISGTLTSSGNCTYNVSHDWANTGTFTSSTSTVNLTGADSSTQTLSGSTSFNNLSVSTSSNSAGRTITHTAGTTQTVTGTWTITGFTGKVITLGSSAASAWTINPTAASVDYAAISYSTNSGSSICATHSTNDGNNTGWSITAGNSCNTAPDSPSSLAQKTTGDVTITTGGWTNTTSIKFTATATDTDNPDTLQLCVEKDILGVSFSNTEDSCGTGVSYSGVGVTVTHTISGQTDASEYHWQARIKDAAGTYSSWVSYDVNAESARDYGLDTTAPTGGTVYDGSGAGVDVIYSDSSLSALSANWASINSDVSGLVKYEYSIGTSAGATDVKTWTDNTTSTSVTATGLTLQSSTLYYVNVRTTDGAGNVSTPISSNGQRVAPSISFTIAPAALTFSNLNFANSYTDTQATTLTTSTNAYNGYVIRAYTTDLLRSTDTLTTIADFSAGSYATPATWAGAETGFGYTSSDTTIGGSNKFGTATLYAPFSHTGPGDIIADHTNTVSGSPVSNEVFTLTYKVKVPASQAAKSYAATVIYTATAQY